MPDAPASDEALLTAFVRGDRAALGILAQRYEKLLLGLAQGILGGRHDLAADAVQETWVRVIRFAGSFKGASSFKTWIYRITVNQCRSIRGLREQPLEQGALESISFSAHIHPSTQTTTLERNAAIHEALERLSPEKRDILLLCYHQGMTHEEAAEVLDIPKGTLKSRLNATLTELRERLDKEAVG